MDGTGQLDLQVSLAAPVTLEEPEALVILAVPEQLVQLVRMEELAVLEQLV